MYTYVHVYVTLVRCTLAYWLQQCGIDEQLLWSRRWQKSKAATWVCPLALLAGSFQGKGSSPLYFLYFLLSSFEEKVDIFCHKHLVPAHVLSFPKFLCWDNWQRRIQQFGPPWTHGPPMGGRGGRGGRGVAVTVHWTAVQTLLKTARGGGSPPPWIHLWLRWYILPFKLNIDDCVPPNHRKREEHCQNDMQVKESRWNHSMWIRFHTP